MKPISPSTVLATTSAASPDHTSDSAETRVTFRGMSAVLLLDARPRLFDVGDAADVEEGLLRDVVEVTADDRVEGLDRLLDRDRGAFDAGELLGHVGVLREELLDAARAGDDDLVLFGELVDTEDRDDLLQLLVLLEDLLDGGGHAVVVGADVARVEDAARRRQRVDGRVQTLRRDLPRELGRRVEVREGRGRRRVGVVVGGDVDRLERRDRVTARRGDALLEDAHLVGEVGLVAHRGRHAAEKRRHLRARLREAEDVVDEQEHVLLLDVAEVLRHRQRRQGDAKTRARRLVHLAEHEGGLSEDARLLHLDHEVVALTGALTDTGEHRHTTVVTGDTGDHLLDEHRLADTGTTEEADLATLDVRGHQVDDLDARLEHRRLGLELVEGRGLAVDAPALLDLERLALLEVEAVAGRVEDLAERDVADRDRDRAAGVVDGRAAHEA